MSAIVQLDEFKNRLPRKPYYTDDVACGLRIADVAKAIGARYIQPNGPTHKYHLVFDIDRPGAAIDWYDRDAPAPTFTVTSAKNAHGHLIYTIEVPVRTAPDGKVDPLRYAAAVEAALRDKLDGDIGYCGLICKNPLHDFWRVEAWEPELYTLDWLADYLDLSLYNDRRKNLPPYGLGRNSTLFERTRKWSYRAIRQGWPELERWIMAVLERAKAYNDFERPLPFNEVKHTAYSIAKWTHKHMGSEALWNAYVARTHTSEIQSKRGKANATKNDMAALGVLGGKANGKARRDHYLPLVLEMHSQGFTNADIAREYGLPRKTVSNWVRSLRAKK